MQSAKYYKEYYEKNKERIQHREKARYNRIKNDPDYKRRCAEATQRYRAKNKDKVKQSRKEQYIKRRIRAMEKLGGPVCVRCGCDEISFLEINHKNGGGCQEHKKKGNYIVDRINNKSRSTDDLEVLCRVCNAQDHCERKMKSKGKFIIRWKNAI